MLSNVTVGDVLVWRKVGRPQLNRATGQYHNSVTISELTVEKIGNRWITFTNSYTPRADKRTGKMESLQLEESGVYPSIEVMNERIETKSRWKILTERLRFSSVDNLSLADVIEIENILAKKELE